MEERTQSQKAAYDAGYNDCSKKLKGNKGRFTGVPSRTAASRFEANWKHYIQGWGAKAREHRQASMDSSQRYGGDVL